MAPITIPNPVMIHVIEYHASGTTLLIRVHKGTLTRKGLRYRFPMIMRSEHELDDGTDVVITHEGQDYGFMEIADIQFKWDPDLPHRKIYLRKTLQLTPQPDCPGGKPQDLWVPIRDLHTLNFGSSSFIRDIVLNTFRYYQRNHIAL